MPCRQDSIVCSYLIQKAVGSTATITDGDTKLEASLRRNRDATRAPFSTSGLGQRALMFVNVRPLLDNLFPVWLGIGEDLSQSIRLCEFVHGSCHAIQHLVFLVGSLLHRSLGSLLRSLLHPRSQLSQLASAWIKVGGNGKGEACGIAWIRQNSECNRQTD